MKLFVVYCMVMALIFIAVTYFLEVNPNEQDA